MTDVTFPACTSGNSRIYIRCKFGDGEWELLSLDEYNKRVDQLTEPTIVVVDSQHVL